MGTRTLQNYLNSLAAKANTTSSDMVPILDNADANKLKKTGIVWLKLNSNGDLELPGKIILADKEAAPTANGEIVRHGDDVKVYSGGAARDLTNIGTRLAWAATENAIGNIVGTGESSVEWDVADGQLATATVTGNVEIDIANLSDWRIIASLVIHNAGGDDVVFANADKTLNNQPAEGSYIAIAQLIGGEIWMSFTNVAEAVT